MDNFLLLLQGLQGWHAALIITAGFIIIWFSSRHVIRNSIGLAAKLNVSTFLIGSIITALMTSLPEIVIAFSAVLQGAPAVSLGNIYSSNLSNMSVALAFPMLFVRKLHADANEHESLIFMIFTAILAMLSALIPVWQHWLFGALLVLAYFVSMIALIKLNRLNSSAPENTIPVGGNEESLWQMSGKLTASLIATTVAGNAIVFGAKIISQHTGMAIYSIGAAFLTLASIIPEIFVNIAAARQGESGFVFGNSIGSLLGQALLVLGFVHGFSSNVDLAHLLYSAPWITVISFVLCFNLYFFRGLNRLAGATLALLYFGFWLNTIKLGLMP